MKQSVILAAGLGLRLKSSLAKPLTLVNNISLLLRTLGSHEIAGCQNTIIVLGSQANIVQEFVCSKYRGPIKIDFVINHNYYLKNGISVLSAAPFIRDDFLLTMADHILDDKIMLLVNNHHPPISGVTLCVDYKINSIFDLDDATKVFTDKGMIKKINKKLSFFNCIDTGVFVATHGLFDAISMVYKERGDASLSEGIQILADKGLVTALDIEDAFWQDVDTPEMLSHAEKLLYKSFHHSIDSLS